MRCYPRTVVLKITESLKSRVTLWAALFFVGVFGSKAELSVTVSAPRVSGQKVVIPITLKNNFTEAVESARAVVFLMDESGKMLGQGTRWVIGGKAEPTAPLIPGATNTFYFVVNSQRALVTTNVLAQVKFSRILIQGGKVADPERDVAVKRGN